MKRIQFYTTGSFLLMTLSAAAETWFAGLSKDHSLFLPSHDLLQILVPTAINRLEIAGLENFPIFWGLLHSTVLQLPLWSIFALTSVAFSYFLMIDSTEIRRHGKDFENLEMWAKSAVRDKEIICEIKGSGEGNAEQKVIKYAHGTPEIWLPDSSEEPESLGGDEEGFLNQHKISDFVSPGTNFSSNGGKKNGLGELNKSIKYAHADPEIWLPISPAEDESADRSENHMVYKDEIYEFDELCDFLDYTERNFYDEQFEEEKLSKFPKNK